jgi:hypothetical protein
MCVVVELSVSITIARQIRPILVANIARALQIWPSVCERREKSSQANLRQEDMAFATG